MSHLNYETRLPLGQATIDHFMGLPAHPSKCQATYVWIDGTGEQLRAKTRTFDVKPKYVSEYPVWNYDGSSTGQAEGDNSDRYLRPVAVFPDPFSGGHNVLVMCDTLDNEMKPTGQWEYQIGTCEGIDMGDQLWISRYILHRVAEMFGVCISLDPKPKVTMGDWNGAGCHTNFSTSEMRKPNGLTAIFEAMKGLEKTHLDAMKVYDPNGGQDNLRRLTGRHETSQADKFTWGVANRACSIRIPRQVADEAKGYLEDRRPSSNCDPYLVTAMIVKSVLLD
ncbi:hypothetical protein GCK72_008730 [Caenorhabditis remanei]|uniref:glutamine synthetase n=1 Tax=Caenorhabditis remanei TaxID=31234 RepID=A0A6A5H0E2_CAERE|nr:hypothetical protein GCK72_008730 [Caenorhabditis remanei]KAF1760481.1 hypothetical protein GCK72_008730 [Caenorhabditis remanei]